MSVDQQSCSSSKDVASQYLVSFHWARALVPENIAKLTMQMGHGWFAYQTTCRDLAGDMHSNPTIARDDMMWHEEISKSIKKIGKSPGCQADTFQSLVPKALTQFAPATNNVAPQNAVERAFAAFIAPWLLATFEV